MIGPARTPIRLERDNLLADLESALQLLSEMAESNPLGRMMLNSRIKEIESELSEIASAPSTVASAAILFSGEPVTGSRSIQAEFAGKMILKVQDLVSKQFAASISALGSRGPVPGSQDTKLQLTGLAFGSFGFVFEEKEASSPAFFDSPMKIALEKTFKVMSDFANGNEAEFRDAIKDLEPRVFFTLREFISELYVNKAKVRVVEDALTRDFDFEQIALAHQRLQQSNIVEDEFVAKGLLIGLIPIGRRFEFKIEETEEIIAGTVGPRVSQDYLERLEREQMIGKPGTAKFLRKTVTNVGFDPTISYLLADITV
jgi:hypothetical protein